MATKVVLSSTGSATTDRMYLTGVHGYVTKICVAGCPSEYELVLNGHHFQLIKSSRMGVFDITKALATEPHGSGMLLLREAAQDELGKKLTTAQKDASICLDRIDNVMLVFHHQIPMCSLRITYEAFVEAACD